MAVATQKFIADMATDALQYVLLLFFSLQIVMIIVCVVDFDSTSYFIICVYWMNVSLHLNAGSVRHGQL